MIAKIAYLIYSIIDRGFLNPENDERILHEIAYAIVLVKAYKILISYLKIHHVNIKYIIEISIIASAIELIFHYDTHSDVVLGIFAVFGIANLLIYLFFQQQIQGIFERFKKKNHEPFRSIKELATRSTKE
jgi:uncharacterized membrane protein (DUF373 family)